MTELGATTTADEVLEGADLRGKRFVVTGASTGLGEETTRALAAKGATVTLAVRDTARGDAAVARIRESVPDADLEVRTVELGSLASIREFAGAFLADHSSIDVLINNAGVMACPQMTTSDGFEMQMGTNHLGHFLLTNLLAPALVAGAPARVVALSSRGHRFSGVDLDDPWFESTPYDPWVAYGRSKTANILFAVELDRRYREQGVRALALHPGGIVTELGRHLTEETMTAMLSSIPAGEKQVWKTVPEGAATSVWAATSPDLEGLGGLYLEDCHIAEPATDPAALSGVRDYAVDPAIAAALWEWSEHQVGLA